MSNGKAGDNAYTDVVHHGIRVFGEPLDGLIGELERTGGCPSELFDKMTNAQTLLWRIEHEVRELLAARVASQG